jgi:hypothetical protein
MGTERLTDEQVGQIVGAIASAAPEKHCRFDNEEARRIHAFSELLDREGMDNFRAVIKFGSDLARARQAGIIAVAGAVALGIAGLIWNALTSRT